MNNNKNLFLAIALSAAVLFAWQYFIANPQMKAEQARQAQLSTQVKKTPSLAAPGAPGVPAMSGTAQRLTREAALKAGGVRIAIDTPMVDGSIRLQGARFDDLRLKKYRQTVDPKSPEIVLLAPKSTDFPYYADIGWIGSNLAVPSERSVWKQTSGGGLSVGKPVTLTWDNGQGLVFTRVIAIDDKYMFTVVDSVANKTGKSATVYPFASISREGIPPNSAGNFVLHEGFVGVANNTLNEAKYKDFDTANTPPKSFNSTGGWIGITDKYWMASVIPPQSEAYEGAYRGTVLGDGTKAYQSNYRLGARNVAAGKNVTVTHRLFAGAKVVETLRFYENTQNVTRFDMAVDWGWLWFFTKPFFWLLDHFYKFLGNFGLAILALTVVVKLVFFPLANTSYRSMSKMKKVQPEMERLKKAHSDDPQKMQAAMMEMYKREKVNPLAGCLPILIQIPVFFALYKVLFVTIEMRHAPFYGWIHDLSAPDPTSILNLFGLLPFNPHSFLPGFLAFLSIGIWPILMGVTQWVQMKLNPAPADPIQARMFTLMPIIFTFMFTTFPAGLVIYYTWNNLLSVLQQYVIMRREGVEIHLFKNSKPSGKAANDA